MSEDLVSIVLFLAPTRAAEAVDVGRGNYAAILAHLRRIDPRLADWVHDLHGVKPLTCSGLMGLERTTAQERARLRPQQEVWVRFTGLTPEVSAALLAALFESPPESWQLGPHRFEVMGAACDADAHPWSGAASYADLAAAFLLDAARPLEPQIELELASPTAFRSKEMNLPLPLPGLVFDSLVKRWNAFSPQPLWGPVREAAEETVAVSRFRLRSEVAEHKQKSLRVGAVGRVSYAVQREGGEWLGVFHLLAEFARYSGVGIQTTTGMGQVRALQKGQ